MPFVNNFNPTTFIDKSVQATGTSDISAAFLNNLQSYIDAQGDGLASYSSDLEALEATVSALGTPYTDQTFITGLEVDWVSVSQISVSAGACYVPATGDVAEKTSITNLTPSGLVANTWYYLYATDVGGNIAFDNLSTTAPAYYMGRARQKSGDSSRRLVAAIRTLPSGGDIMPFQRQADMYLYRPSLAGWSMWESPFFIGSRTGISVASVGMSGLVPAATRLALVSFLNLADRAFYVGDPATVNTSDFDLQIEGRGGSDLSSHWVGLNSSLQWGNRFGTTPTNGEGCYYHVQGYRLER